MKYIMKFGGTSVKDAGYGRICEIVSNYKTHKVVVVVSALKGITDSLIEAARKAGFGEKEWVSDFIAKSKEIQRMTLRASIGTIPVELEQRLSKADGELERVLFGVQYLKEMTPRSLDYIMSFGERYSSEIAAATLTSSGFKSKALTGGEAGIVTDKRFGQSTPIMDRTRRKVASTVVPLLENGIIPVVGGFSGMTEDGITTTFGRGGSDYTATILANCINADEVMLWSDVDGIMSADPKIVPKAVTLSEITYDEAIEMAILGAKFLHPRALEPAIEGNIPVRLKNTFRPEHEGTIILGKVKHGFPAVAKLVALVSDVGLLTVRGSSMVGEPGTAAGFFSKLAGEGINISMISQSVSESNISVVMKREQLEKARNALGVDFERVNKKLELESDVSVIAIVGQGMSGTPGVAAEIFRSVADAGVNIRMIAQGSNELSISLVVRENDSKKAIRALHETMIERKIGMKLEKQQ